LFSLAGLTVYYITSWVGSFRPVLIGLALLFFPIFLWDRQKGIAYIRTLVLLLVAVAILIPFFWVLAGALKDKSVMNSYLFFPPFDQWSWDTVNFKNFMTLFAGESTPQGKVYFWQFIVNSLFLASTTTIVQLFFSSLAGYALAKYSFKGKGPVTVFMLGTMMIPPVILLAPIYEIIHFFNWIDSFYALIVPTAVNAFGILLFRQAIIGVPSEIIESGRVDGSSELSIYWYLVMPIVRPISATFCLVAFLGSWSSFFAPNIFLHTTSKLPLPVILNMYVGHYIDQYGVFLAGTVLAIIPPAILFFALQKEFVQGLKSGAVKG